MDWRQMPSIKASCLNVFKALMKGHFAIARLYAFTTCTNWNIAYI